MDTSPNDSSASESPASAVVDAQLTVVEGGAPGPTPPAAGDAVEDAIIQRHVLWAMSAGLIPVPLADLAAVAAIQLDALKQLAKHHNAECGDDTGKAFVTALSGGAVARIGASAVKALPGVGTLIGGLTMAGLSAASTYAVCHVASHQFRTGKNLLTENTDKLKEAYRDALEKGKKFVAKLKESGVDTRVSEATETIAQLGALRDKGVLNEEEFAAKKAGVLEKLVG